MPYCSSCGLSLSQGAPVCPACGSWTAAASAPASDAPVRRPAATHRATTAAGAPARPAGSTERPVRQPSVVRVARSAQAPLRPTVIALPSVERVRPPWAQAQAAVAESAPVLADTTPSQPTARAAVLEPARPIVRTPADLPAQTAGSEAAPPAQAAAAAVVEAAPAQAAAAAVVEEESPAQAAVAEAAPLAHMILVEPAEPDAEMDAAVTYWPALPSDDEAPPWSAEAAAEPASARRSSGARQASRPAARPAWTTGPRLAGTILIGLVCLAAVLGFARGVTMSTVIHLATGATQPALAQYRQLRAGLSYDQVDAIFAGKLGLGASAADARVHRSYGSARLDLRFSGGVLQSFSERGLSEGPSLRVLRTSGRGPLLFSLAGGLANAAAWWLLLFLAASWRGEQLTTGRLAVLAAAALAVGLVAALLLSTVLGCAVVFAVFLGLLIGRARREVAESLIVAAIAAVGGSLAVWLPVLLGLQLSLLFTR